MKAFQWSGRPGSLVMTDVPVPKPGDNDLLIEVKAMGICGTEVNFRKGNFPPPLFLEAKPWKLPLTIGHEYAGVVAKKGSLVKGFKEGDRVSINYVVSCGKCTHCLRGGDNVCLSKATVDFDARGYEGGFAEYALIPSRNAFPLPKKIPFEQGAIIGCAVTTSLHAVQARAAMRVGETVVVWGLGGVGLHVVQWARVLGAKRVVGVDVNEFKLKVARDFGATQTVNANEGDQAKQVLAITDNLGADIAIDTVGSERTINQAIGSTRAHGRVVVVGLGTALARLIPVNVASMMFSERNVTGSTDHTIHDHKTAMEYVSSGKYDLSRSVTLKLPFEKLDEAVGILSEGTQNVVRIVVTR